MTSRPLQSTIAPTSSVLCHSDNVKAAINLRDPRREVHDACVTASEDSGFEAQVVSKLESDLGEDVERLECASKVSCGSINVTLYFEDKDKAFALYNRISDDYFNDTKSRSSFLFEHNYTGQRTFFDFEFEWIDFTTPVSETPVTTPAPVDCTGMWSGWSECSQTCGTGTTSRTFSVVAASSNGGDGCLFEDGETGSSECVMEACPGTTVVTFEFDFSDAVDEQDLEDAINEIINNDDSEYEVIVRESIDMIVISSTYSEVELYNTEAKQDAVESFLLSHAGDMFEVSTRITPSTPIVGQSVVYELEAEGEDASKFFEDNLDAILQLLCDEDDYPDLYEDCVANSTLEVTSSTVTVAIVAPEGATEDEIDGLVEAAQNSTELVNALETLDPQYGDLVVGVQTSIDTPSYSVGNNGSTDEDMNTTIIIVVCLIVVVILVVVVVLIVLKKQKHGKHSMFLHPELDPMVIGTTKLRGDLTAKSQPTGLQRSASLTRASPIGPMTRSSSQSRLDDIDEAKNARAARTRVGARLPGGRRRVGVRAAVDGVNVEREGGEDRITVGGPSRRRRARVGVASDSVTIRDRVAADMAAGDSMRERSEDRVSVSFTRNRRSLRKNARNSSFAQQAAARDAQYDDSFDEGNAAQSGLRKTRVGPSRRRIMSAGRRAPAATATPVGPARRRLARGPPSVGPSGEHLTATDAVRTLSDEVEDVKSSVEKTRVGPTRRGQRPISAVVNNARSRPVSAVGVSFDVGEEVDESSNDEDVSEGEMSPVARAPRHGLRAVHSFGDLGDDPNEEDAAVPLRPSHARRRVQPRFEDADNSNVTQSLTPSGTNVTRTHVGPSRRRRRAPTATVHGIEETNESSTELQSRVMAGNSMSKPANGDHNNTAAPAGQIQDVSAPSIGGRQPPRRGPQINTKIGPRRLGARRGPNAVATTVSAADPNQTSPKAAANVRAGPGRGIRDRETMATSERVQLGPGRHRTRAAAVAATESADISVTGDAATEVQTTRIGPARAPRRRQKADVPEPIRSVEQHFSL